MKTDHTRESTRPEDGLSPEERRLAQTVSAVAALKASRPVAPSADSLARLQARIGSRRSGGRGSLAWLAAGGWVAAAVAIGFLILDRHSARSRASDEDSGRAPLLAEARVLRQPGNGLVAPWPEQAVSTPREMLDSMMPSLRFALRPVLAGAAVPAFAAEVGTAVAITGAAPHAGDAIQIAESDLLGAGMGPRGQAVTGIALAEPAPLGRLPSHLQHEIHAGASVEVMSGMVANEGATAHGPMPVAMEIELPEGLVDYDPRADKGRLAVSGLSPLPPGKVYRLYVVPRGERAEALLFGELPETPRPGGEVFDFKLGGLGRLPAGFYLTMEDAASRDGFDAANLILRS